MIQHRNCTFLANAAGEKFEVEVVECNKCGFHLGIDASYLELVKSVGMNCPSCGIGLWIPGDGDENHEDFIKNFCECGRETNTNDCAVSDGAETHKDKA